MEEREEKRVVVSSDKDIFEATEKILRFLDDIPMDVMEIRLPENLRTMKYLLHGIQEYLTKRGKEKVVQTHEEIDAATERMLSILRKEIIPAMVIEGIPRDIKGRILMPEDEKDLLIDTAEAILWLGDALRDFFRDKESQPSLRQVAGKLLNRVEADLLRLKGVSHSLGSK